jgi:hypothetical protein
MAASQTILPPINRAPIVDENGFLTPSGLNLFQQIWTGVFGSGAVIPGLFLLGSAQSINFNVLGDTAINLTRPPGSIGWRAQLGMVFGTSGAFATARAGLYSLAFKNGTTLIGQTALSAITQIGINAPGALASLTPGTTAIWDYDTIYLNVGTAEGAASLGSFYLYGYPVY